MLRHLNSVGDFKRLERYNDKVIIELIQLAIDLHQGVEEYELSVDGNDLLLLRTK
jgi:hypothetical protein